MAKKAEKFVLIDFPAKLILLEGRDGLGYPKVQPLLEGFVISHSWRPQGGIHARAFSGRSPVQDLGKFPDSYVWYVQTNPQGPTRIEPPRTAATVSIAPTDYTTFTGLTAYRAARTGGLIIDTSWEGLLSLAFWERGALPGNYQPILAQRRVRR